MQPDFKILADRKDVTAAIRDRLLSLSIQDEAGQKSDTAEIRLDDRDHKLVLPRHGAELELYLGFKNQGLHKMGLYTVDELAINASPATLTIRARAANFRASLKEQQTRSWDQITLGDMVKSIATSHGLEPKIPEELATIAISHLDQTEESDLHLLTRLAKQYGALAKPVAGKFVFAKRGVAKSVSGKNLSAITLVPGQCSQCQVSITDRNKYGAVTAKWHNTQSGQEVQERIGTEKPVFSLRRKYTGAAEARTAAAAKLKQLNSGKASGSLTATPGNPALLAEGKLYLKGFKTGINGPWIITKATHELNNNGLITKIHFETPPDT